MKISNNLKSTLRVAKIELNSMFYSPVAWLIIFIFVCQIGYSFVNKFDGYLRYQDLGENLGSLTTGIFTGMLGILAPILGNLYLYIPLITMGLMSREYSSGSIKLLYSSPIRNSSIILGKFVSMMIYGVALLGILIFITLFGMVFIKDFDLPILLIALLGFYLLILAYSAIGIFMSSLTPYPVVAALGTLALLAALNFVGEIGQSIDFVRDITYWLSISGRSSSFLQGLVSSEDVVYYLIVIGFFLSLAIFKINTEKTIMSSTKKIIGYCSIILVTFVCGYITSRPELKFYYDGTQDLHNTLSKESQRIIATVEKEKGNLKIITYVNILAQDYHSGLPENRIDDKQRFDKYIRFMPAIEMEYVLYYDKTEDPSYTTQRYQTDDLRETAELVCTSENLDINKILTPEQFKAKYGDFSAERNKFVRVIETKDGQKELLRLYNDNNKYPFEPEISAALSRFVFKAPMVAFYSNNENRAVNNYGDRGFYLFAHDKWFRNSLLNQGFDTKTLDLDKEEIKDVDVLVLSDLKDSLSDVAMAKIVDYYQQGGNMFILGEYRRSENMNKLTQMLGVEFSDGVLVEENGGIRSPVIIRTKFTQAAADKFFTYTKLKLYGYEISANTAVTLNAEKSKEKGFTVTEILKSVPNSWLEYQTTDFIDGVFSCDSTLNESKEARVVLLSLDREVNGKSQRILVSGDTDMIANGELTANNIGISAQNYSIINGSFRWLSNDVYPVDVRLADTTDDEIYLPKGSRKYVKGLFMFAIPLILLIFGITLIVKRQRK